MEPPLDKLYLGIPRQTSHSSHYCILLAFTQYTIQKAMKEDKS